MLYVCNAFALSMLDRVSQAETPRAPRPVSLAAAQDAAAAARETGHLVSCVGHADAAAIYADLLGVPVSANRASIKLGPADELLVGQYIGPRLPEGATELPAGAAIEWWLV